MAKVTEERELTDRYATMYTAAMKEKEAGTYVFARVEDARRTVSRQVRRWSVRGAMRAISRQRREAVVTVTVGQMKNVATERFV